MYEEVFSSDYALWWAPDASAVAFLAEYETAVDEYTFMIYNLGEDAHAVVPYPAHVVMKYPKSGYANPLMQVHVFRLDRYLAGVRQGGTGNLDAARLAREATVELDWDGRLARDYSVIAEVAWVSGSTLLVKEVNRAAEDGHVVYFELGDGTNVGTPVRKLGKDGEQGDDGWIDAVCAASFVLI